MVDQENPLGVCGQQGRPYANWAPHPNLQTLVQADWEPGATEIVPSRGPTPPKADPGGQYSYM